MAIDWAGLHEAIFGSGGNDIDWTTIIAGLGGAAIGGGISYASNRQNVAAQKEALAVQRETFIRQRRIERREEAYQAILVPLSGILSAANTMPLTRALMGDQYLNVHQWLFETQTTVNRFPLAVSTNFRDQFDLLRAAVMQMDPDKLQEDDRTFVRSHVASLFTLARVEVETDVPADAGQ